MGTAVMVGVRFKPSPSNGRPTAVWRVVVFEEAVVTPWRMTVGVRYSPYASTKGCAVNAVHRCSNHECTVNAVHRYRWMYGKHRTARATKADAPAALLHQSGRLDPSQHSGTEYRWPKKSPKTKFSKADQVDNCFVLASHAPERYLRFMQVTPRLFPPSVACFSRRSWRVWTMSSRASRV